MKEPSKEAPIVVQSDLVAHLIQRIDHYLYKRWPDVFLDDQWQKWKADLEEKYNRVIHLEKIMTANYKEWEKRADSRVNSLERTINDMQKTLALKEKHRWWRFWK